jgi:hypothetical protein
MEIESRKRGKIKIQGVHKLVDYVKCVYLFTYNTYENLYFPEKHYIIYQREGETREDLGRDGAGTGSRLNLDKR